MLRYCLVLAAGLLAAETASASWADKMFDELSKDFGSVPRGPMLKHYFRVVNNTKEPVVISSVRVSCGCTSATALKTYLKPGEETHIYATMDTTRFIGPKTVTIFVQFSQPGFEEVRLWVQANGRNDFTVGPDTLALGQARRGTSPSGAVVVTFYGMADTKITEIKTESNYIRTEVKPIQTQGSEAAFELRAALRSDTPVGKWYSDVWLKTNNPTIPQIRIPLTVEIESALSVSPDLISVGQVKVNGENERRVVVRGAQPFKITKIEGTDDLLTVKDNAEEAKQVHVLTVKIKATKAGELQRTIKVKTDLKEENEIDFRVTATIMP
jgi:Protein of unknown function (DUF1573)